MKTFESSKRRTVVCIFLKRSRTKKGFARSARPSRRKRGARRPRKRPNARRRSAKDSKPRLDVSRVALR